jgi:putative cell wall-binding protein
MVSGRGIGLDVVAAAVERVGGETVYATAAAISRWSHPDGASTAYVATVDTYVDALAGVSVAVRDGAPILLVGDDGLGSDIKTELERLGVDRVVALGGNEAVLPRVAMEVWSLLNDNDMPLWK